MTTSLMTAPHATPRTTSPAAATLAAVNPWTMVPPLGNLDAYISAANRLPMLTLEEEKEFARKFRNENDLEAASKLVLSTCGWWFPFRASTWATACRMVT